MSRLADAPPVAIVAALPEELAPILRRAHGVEPAAGKRTWRGFLGGVRCVLAVTGDGMRRAERAAEALCREVAPSALYGCGIAGALSPSLARFDLVVARRVVDESGDAPAPDAELLARTRQIGDPAAAVLLTVGRPVVDPGQKAALHAALGFDEPAAVDMESAGWARGAASSGVPYAIVRAVTDTAADALPALLLECLGPDGGIRRGAVLWRALLRPRSLPALAAMRRHLAHGAGKLALFLERLLAESA